MPHPAENREDDCEEFLTQSYFDEQEDTEARTRHFKLVEKTEKEEA